MKKKVLCLMLLISLLCGCSKDTDKNEVDIMNDTAGEIVETITVEDLSIDEDERYFHQVYATTEDIIGTWKTENSSIKIELDKDGSFYMYDASLGEKYKTETWGSYILGNSGEDDPNVLWESINIEVTKIVNASGKGVTNEGFIKSRKYYINSLGNNAMELRIDSSCSTEFTKAR